MLELVLPLKMGRGFKMRSSKHGAAALLAAMALANSTPASAAVELLNYTFHGNGGMDHGTMSLDFDAGTSDYTLKTLDLTFETDLIFATFYEDNSILFGNHLLEGSNFRTPPDVYTFHLEMDPTLRFQTTTAYFQDDPGERGSPISDSASVDIAQVVPEPAEWVLMLVGFAGLGAALRTQRRPAQAHS
jgi:hypothetical protein